MATTLCFNWHMSTSEENARQSLADLDESEKRLLAQLIRVTVRSDGSFTSAEREHLDGLAEVMGGEDFFKLLDEVATLDEATEEIVAKAKGIGDKDSHELIYGALYELSIIDGTDGGENELLDKLAAGWKLEISEVTE